MPDLIETSTGAIFVGNDGTSTSVDAIEVEFAALPGAAGSPVLPPLSFGKRFSMAAAFVSAQVESIIGDDDRTFVFDTRKRPARLVCALEIHSARGTTHGTAWLAGPSLAITCGHCLFEPAELGGWAQSVTVTPGLYENSAPFGSVSSNAFAAPEQWLQQRLKPWDIAAIRLPRPIGNDLGWFRVEPVTDAAAVRRVPATLAGYPVFDGAHSRQMRHSDLLLGAAGGRLFHQIDSMDGQSGAPVWLGGWGQEDPPVVAVHAYEKEQTPASLGVEANSATPITPPVAALIQIWGS